MSSVSQRRWNVFYVLRYKFIIINCCDSETIVNLSHLFIFVVYYEIFPFICEIIVSHKAEQFPVKKYKNYHKNNFSYWKIWISLIFHFVNKRKRVDRGVCIKLFHFCISDETIVIWSSTLTIICFINKFLWPTITFER